MIKVYGGVLENPEKNMAEFNAILEQNKGNVLKEHKIIPFADKKVAIMTFILDGTPEAINKFGCSLGAMDSMTVKTAATK